MDTASAVGAVFAAFGLSGAAGLNAWLPLLAAAGLARLDVIELAAPFDELTTTTGLVVLAVATVLDFVGDKVPVVDSVLHGVGTLVAPASGAALFTGQTGLETELPTAVAAVVGGLVALAVHAERATVRPAVTAGTAGTTNPVVSLLEDLGSLALVAVALLVPVLAFLAVLALIGAGLLAARRLRRTLAARAPTDPG